MKIHYNEGDKTLKVWRGDFAEEFIVEETDGKVLLIQNQPITAIRFEHLNSHFTVNRQKFPKR